MTIGERVQLVNEGIACLHKAIEIFEQTHNHATAERVRDILPSANMSHTRAFRGTWGHSDNEVLW
jgi:hypothetical protein